MLTGATKAAIAVVTAIVSCGIAEPASAQTFRCAARNLTSGDQRHLAAAMRSALPAAVALDAAPTICRNPESARAWLETTHHTNAEGAQEWWVLQCNRVTRNWRCDSPERKREIGLSVPISGQSRNLSIEFDDKTPMDIARALSIRSFQILEAPEDPPPECIDSGSDRVDVAQWRRMQDQYRLKPSDVALTTTVSLEEEGFSVWLSRDGGLAFTFLRPLQPADAPRLKCWSEWVIIT